MVFSAISSGNVLFLKMSRCLHAWKSGLILKPTRHLTDGSYLANIYPTPYDREKDRHGIEVRVIRYKLDDPQRVGP